MNLCPFVGWFVSRITHKLLNRNLNEGWILGQNRPHSLLVQILIKGQIKEFFSHFLYQCEIGHFSTFPFICQGTMHGS